ncbi:MAG: leucine-rich repeat protein [Lachnospiraceae bacterium]|jgi:hypothetical protein|nr:leucine-rich repeat protein [Lachnospiraceae bacterium]
MKSKRFLSFGMALALLCTGLPQMPALAEEGVQSALEQTEDISKTDAGNQNDDGNTSAAEESNQNDDGNTSAAEESNQNNNRNASAAEENNQDSLETPLTKDIPIEEPSGAPLAAEPAGLEPPSPGTDAKAAASGQCGESVYWAFSNGKLTISGAGAMASYTSSTPAPWNGYQDRITQVELQEGVTSVGAFAFSMCKKLEKATLPATVGTISAHAFSGCKKLQSITLPPSLTSIWNNAFSGCSSLKNLRLPSALQFIGYLAFEGCTGMQAFAVEEGSAYFSADKGALFDAGMATLLAYPIASPAKSYTVPRQAKQISPHAFEGCQNLEAVTLPEGLEQIGDYTFYQCGLLKKVSLPSTVTSIGDFAFSECLALEELPLPASLLEIGNYAFADCRSLASITLPGKVTSIGDYAFRRCLKLKAADLPSSVAWIGLSAFWNCQGLTRVTIRNQTCELPNVDNLFPERAVICGYKNSTAQSYAKKYKRDFEEIGSRPVKKISLNKKKLSLKLGKTATLKASVSPSNASNKKITWISSNPGVASVSSKGKVKACTPGKVTVMAKSPNGKLASCAVTVTGKNQKTNTSMDTASLQDYPVTSSTPLSALALTSSGYMGVTAIRQVYSCTKGKTRYSGSSCGGVLAEYYNKSFRRTSKKKIPMELSKYGGFYAGKDAYFLVFGQDNPQDNDNVEVLRVVKYSKKWKRLGAASLRGADTTEIFHAGNLRMAEYNGHLVVRTCHTMYDDGTGTHHQGTLTMVVNMSDLKDVCWYDFDISHSFNQFILADDKGHLVTLDHGDANPRAAVLKEYDAATLVSGAYDSLYFASERVHTLEYPSYKKLHYNNTGGSVGGLSYSASHYLTAGNSVAHNKKFQKNKTRNIYITLTPRNQVSTTATKVKQITSYKEGGSLSASTPQLVKLSDNAFLLLWERISHGNKRGKISYVFLDGKGRKTSKVYTKSGYLSDCQPILSKGSAIWYVRKSGKTIFYRIQKNGALKSWKVTGR